MERRRKSLYRNWNCEGDVKVFREGVFFKNGEVRWLLAGHGDERGVGYFGKDILEKIFLVESCRR